MTMTGDMGIVKGVSLMKMIMGKPNKRRLMDLYDNVRETWMAPQPHNRSGYF